MPKANLEFNLPEEQDDFTLATNGSKMHGMIWDAKNILRNYRKYYDFSQHGVHTEELEKFFEKLDNELMETFFDLPEVS